MKLFKATTTVSGPKHLHFVDWYEGATLAEAKSIWDEDCHRYGLPKAQTTVEFVECDPETLKEVYEADSHASDCASRQHSASECTCGLADRLAAQEREAS